MAKIVDKSTDFREIMMQCLENYNDNSYETRQRRVDDWLWITKSNRTISNFNDDDDSSYEEFMVKNDLSEVMAQVSNFTDITDKKIYCLYLILTSPEFSGLVKLRTDLASDSLNNDNQEVNSSVDAWSYVIGNFDRLIMDQQVNNLIKILGEDKVNEIKYKAPKTLETEGVSNLMHYLSDYVDNPDWPKMADAIKATKSVYRDQLRNKFSIIYASTTLFRDQKITEDSFISRAQKLRQTIKENMTSEGVNLSGRTV